MHSNIIDVESWFVLFVIYISRYLTKSRQMLPDRCSEVFRFVFLILHLFPLMQDKESINKN